MESKRVPQGEEGRCRFNFSSPFSACPAVSVWVRCAQLSSVLRSGAACRGGAHLGWATRCWHFLRRFYVLPELGRRAGVCCPRVCWTGTGRREWNLEGTLAGVLQVHRVAKSQTRLSDWAELMDERKALAARASLQRSLESPTLNLRAGGCCECRRLLAAAAAGGLRETWRHPESVRSEGGWEAETGRRKVREGTQPSAVPADCAGRRLRFLPCFALVIHLSRPASRGWTRTVRGWAFRGIGAEKDAEPRLLSLWGRGFCFARRAL